MKSSDMFTPCDPPQSRRGLGSRQMRVSEGTVRRLFADEPGVIDLGRHETMRSKRRYRILRIPSTVVARFLERRSVK